MMNDDFTLVGRGVWPESGRRGRVLRPKGVFFIVSYGIPDNRLQYLENEDYSWTVTIHTVGQSPLTLPIPPFSFGISADQEAWLS
jgi:hypothetical protein